MLVDSQEKVEFRLVVVVEPDGDEFHAYCPALKGLHTSGQTVEEAVNNAKDAASAYLLSLVKHHDPIPVGCTTLKQPQRTSATLRHNVWEYETSLSVALA